MIPSQRLKHVFLALSCVGMAGVAEVGIGGQWAIAAAPLRRADAGSFTAILQSAHGGEQIVLAPGDYGSVRFPSRTYSPSLQIDARNARFTHVLMQGVSGVTITGGVVDGPRSQSNAVGVDFAHDIEVQSMRTSGTQVGISVSRSQHVAVVDNIFDGVASDGVNIAGSQDVRVEHNICRNFHPTLATYDATGKLVKDGNHPDCIQGWSIRGRPPLADITIIGNTGRGLMQGVFIGNPEPGSINRIVVRDNTFDLAAYNGIAVMGSHGGRISHNVVRTIPGARALNYPFRPITTWIKVKWGDDNVVCGNTVDVPRWSDDQGPCRDGKR